MYDRTRKLGLSVVQSAEIAMADSKQGVLFSIDRDSKTKQRDILNRHKRQVHGKRDNTTAATGVQQTGRHVATRSPTVVAENGLVRMLTPPSSGQQEEIAITSSRSFYLTGNACHSDASTAIPSESEHVIDSAQSGLTGLNTWPSNTGAASLFPATFVDSVEQFSPWIIDPDLHDDILQINFSPPGDNFAPERAIEESTDLEGTQAQNIQHLWFSYISKFPTDTVYLERGSGQSSDLLAEEESLCSDYIEIDDPYRKKLQQRLKIIPCEPTVPSAALLNACIRLYFARVHPLFPLVHAATFRPCKANSSLLLAMCAMGSLFTGSDSGLQQGMYLFERIHKASLQNWEPLLANKQDCLVNTIQCALIAEMFGLLCGCPNVLLTVDAFHGPPIAWARHIRLHRARPEASIDLNTDDSQLHERWKEWAHNEELLRLAHGLYILDVELASLLHHEPFQSFSSYSFAFASSDSAFMASNAKQWKELYLAEMQERSEASSCVNDNLLLPSRYNFNQVPRTSRLTAYAILEGISMQILSRWADNRMTSWPLTDFHQPLADFHKRFIQSSTDVAPDQLQLHILWHAVYMTVFADFDLLERAIGREGHTLSPRDIDLLTTWANSDEGLKCILHSLMIKKHVQGTSVISDLAMHVPRAIFWAAMALICYIRFGTRDEQLQSLLNPTILNYIEQFSMGIDRPTFISELSEFVAGDSITLKTTVFMMTDLLQRVGHWEISRKFASILTAASNFTFHHGQK